MTIEELRSMTPEQLHEYFCEHARYFMHNPYHYEIRIGSDILRDNDTMDLFKKFTAYIKHASS